MKSEWDKGLGVWESGWESEKSGERSVHSCLLRLERNLWFELPFSFWKFVKNRDVRREPLCVELIHSHSYSFFSFFHSACLTLTFPLLSSLSSISLSGVICAFSLDTSTTSLYLPFATSAYGKHSLLSTIGSLSSIITACCKPLIAKVSDITSRQFAYAMVLILYVLGYVLCSGTREISGFAVGQILSTVGQAGSTLITDILLADLSPLELRVSL